MELYTVDSVRDDVVRLLLRRDEAVVLSLPHRELSGVREGDIISAEIVQGAVIRFALEKEETEAARKRIKAKLAKLKNPSGR